MRKTCHPILTLADERNHDELYDHSLHVMSLNLGNLSLMLQHIIYSRVTVQIKLSASLRAFAGIDHSESWDAGPNRAVWRGIRSASRCQVCHALPFNARMLAALMVFIYRWDQGQWHSKNPTSQISYWGPSLFDNNSRWDFFPWGRFRA